MWTVIVLDDDNHQIGVAVDHKPYNVALDALATCPLRYPATGFSIIRDR